MIIIDTNIAIHLRDGHDMVVRRLLELPSRPALSLLSIVELEGGMTGRSEPAVIRRSRFEAMLRRLEVIAFDEPVVAAYRNILTIVGFSRRRILDRLIAATAIVHDLTLVTMNAEDFRDIPGLKLERWPAPQ